MGKENMNREKDKTQNAEEKRTPNGPIKGICKLVNKGVKGVIKVFSKEKENEEILTLGNSDIPEESIEPTVSALSDSDNRSSEKISPEEHMREVLKRRNYLEESILKLIGGKTGMLMTWDEIIQCASAGDDGGFLLFAGSFPQKASILEEEFKELTDIIKKSGYQMESSRSEIARQLTLPYRYESECRKLLDNSLRLTKSNLLEKERINSDELLKWYSRYTSDSTRTGNLQTDRRADQIQKESN